VWDIFPGLLLVFWNEAALAAIGNKIGRFVSLEPNWASKAERHWAWFQVEVDPRDS
jgi:hypothetical protein